MTGEVESTTARAQRTRRNILKIGAIVAPTAIIAATRADAAGIPCGPIRRILGLCSTDGGNSGSGSGSNCFLKGTMIRTVDGERKVEELAIGDALPTAFGGTTPIQWIARYRLKKGDPSKPWGRDAMPVRVARSALAPGVPQANLYVTGNHALFVDGRLIAVGNLINGTSIVRHEARESDELEFFNIKLERHDVIYAEGAPVETLLEVDERAVNFSEYFRQYGMPDMQETPCAPRVSYGGGRGEVRSRLRSAISPWLDRRDPVDIIRDRLEERGIVVSRQLAAVS